jgi:hypothetical protein
MSRLAYSGLFVSLLLVFTACGGEDPGESPDTVEAPDESEDDTPDEPDTPDETTDTTTAEETGDADNGDSIRDVDLSARITGLEVALNGVAELVDDNTVRMTFDDGVVATGSIRSCAVASSLLDEGMTLIVVYPDGEKTCG